MFGRMVPRALQNARVDLIATAKSREELARRSRLAARKPRPDVLRLLIWAWVRQHVDGSERDLLRYLKRHAAAPDSPILSVSDSQIEFDNRGTVKTAKIGGLKDRLSREKANRRMLRNVSRASG